MVCSRRRSRAGALAAPVVVAALVLVGCERHARSYDLTEGDAGAAPAFTLAPLALESKTTARWWSLPDGGPRESEYYPCVDCHDEDRETNPKPRVLEEDHEDLVFAHGGGKMWCLSCHHEEDHAVFTDGVGRKIPADRPDRACATCHVVQQRDFEHGVHGKRVGRFRGERVLTRCSACHDPHAPAIGPRRPLPPPRRPGTGSRAR